MLALLAMAAPLHAKPAPAPAGPPALCGQAIGATEKKARLPAQLLATIALIESGRQDPSSGLTRPWPWTINAEGTGFFFETKEQAIAAVQALQESGVRSIDVGCMQINLMHHATAFSSLDEAFDPQANVAYAARFLNQLYAQTNDWPKAAAAYHSQTPDIGADYQRRVMALWPLGAQYGSVDSVSLPLPPGAPPKPTPYTAEFARRLAQDAADRANLYVEMGMRSAGAAGRASLVRTALRPALPKGGSDRVRMIRATAEAVTMLPAEAGTAAFRPSRTNLARRRLDLARATAE